MTLWLGIDLGKEGAFVAVSNEGIVHAFDMPLEARRKGKGTVEAVSPALLRDELLALQSEHGKIRMAVLEEVTSFGMGKQSALNFGKGIGLVVGLLTALCIPYTEVRPQRWKKDFGLNNEKAASLSLARAKWPASDLFSRKKDDGRAEAALMAEYGRRNGL